MPNDAVLTRVINSPANALLTHRRMHSLTGNPDWKCKVLSVGERSEKLLGYRGSK